MCFTCNRIDLWVIARLLILTWTVIRCIIRFVRSFFEWVPIHLTRFDPTRFDPKKRTPSWRRQIAELRGVPFPRNNCYEEHTTSSSLAQGTQDVKQPWPVHVWAVKHFCSP